MKKKVLIFIISFLLFLNSFAVFEYIPGNVQSKSMAFATTGMLTGIENITVNPASIVGLDKYQVSVSYENLYRFIHTVSISGGYYSNYGNLGLKYSELFVLGDYSNMDSIISTNTRLQTERVVQLTYGMGFNDVIMVGTNINFLFVEQKMEGIDDNNNIYYTADLGIIGRIYDRWFIGLSVSNLTDTYIVGSMSNERYYITRKVSGGLTFSPYESLTTNFDLSKTSGEPTSFGFSFKSQIVKNVFTIFSGVRNYPATLGLGFELKIKNISIDYGYTTVINLPSRNHIQLSYSF
ncbi:MAG: hypothetical protein ABIN11_01940 [candidate division WOR-3 bacterium]